MGVRVSAALYIDRHGAKLGVSQGRLTLKSPEHEEQTLPIQQIEQIIVLGHAHFSHDAIAALLRGSILVIFSSLDGGFRGTLCSRPRIQIEHRKRQLQAMDDPDQRTVVVRALALAKITRPCPIAA